MKYVPGGTHKVTSEKQLNLHASSRKKVIIKSYKGTDTLEGTLFDATTGGKLLFKLEGLQMVGVGWRCCLN